MSFPIEVVAVKVENKGKFRVASVTYKDKDGKVDNKAIVSFANATYPATAEVFKTLSQSQQGDQYDVTSQKDEKGFWQWTSAISVGKNVQGASSSVAKIVKSSYETTEERAARQVYIVRQSSISSAIDYLVAQGGKPKFDVNEVIAVAQQFETHVFSKDPSGELLSEPVEVE